MSSTDDQARRDARFHTTQWSLVRAAGDSQREDAQEALAELCRNYWYPVYAFVRRRVSNTTDAQDLTQEFFATLIEKNYVGGVRRDLGRFRTFLLTAVQRFLSKERTKARAKKRGGDKAILSLDFTSGESQYALEPADDETPQRAFDRQWALRMLEIVQQRLRDEYIASDKSVVYERLKPLLTGIGERGKYEAVAVELDMTAAAVKTALYRMRRRYRELLRAEIAETVAEADEIDDEVDQLFAALG